MLTVSFNVLLAHRQVSSYRPTFEYFSFYGKCIFIYPQLTLSQKDLEYIL